MNRTRHIVYISLAIFSISLLPHDLFSQSVHSIDSIQVVSSKQTGFVRTITVDEMRYVSLQNIAELLLAAQFENRLLKKLEIKFPGTTVKFSSDNSFVVITQPETKKNFVRQFSSMILLEDGIYYANSGEIVSLLRSFADSALSIAADTVTPVVRTPQIPTITGFTLEKKKNGSLFRIHLSGKVNDVNRTLQIGEWIYVTLPGVQCDTVKFDTTFADGIVRRVKPVQSESSLQLSLQLRGKVEQSEIVPDQLSDDIFLTLIPRAHDEGKEPKVDSAALRRQQAELKRQQLANSIERQKQKWKLDVVVIDPGHGGHDPGAIGLIGTREKDITLGISLKLGELIQKEIPDVKVVFTRKTDRFIELYRRGQIANESGGKIFISIHCNSTERKPSSANGFEIYLLRPGKTEDAIRIAEKENDVVKLEKDFEDRYQELTEENFIILTMAQSSYVKQSERFAEMLEETMSAQMEGQRQPVKQAGFYVLVGASMPNVLVETGYLSNVKDERFLRSPAGQKKIATAMLNGLKGYMNEYEGENQ